jgi:excisionase family DNA binding protein
MAAYATSQLGLVGRSPRRQTNGIDLSKTDTVPGGSLVDALIDQIAARVVELLTGATHPLLAGEPTNDDWLDSRHAAEYLGVHRDTLRKLAAERAIPSEQNGPGCKLYFRRSDLDAWRQSGGRPRHLCSTIASAA